MLPLRNVHPFPEHPGLMKGMIAMNKSYKVNANISLHYIPMKKLKTTTLGVYIHRALNEEEASMNALLPFVLKRGCRLCKDTTEIAHYLENLYGASLSAGILKKGEDQIISFDAETISDQFAPNGELLLSNLIELLLSMIFEPLTENGGFVEDFVEREKKNAIDRIESVINDKRTYAQLRCMQEMCKGEPFEVNKLGSVEGIQKITAAGLYCYYKNMIAESMIDIFICGETDINQITEAVKGVKLPFANAKLPKTEILTRAAEVKTVTERLDVTQGKLSIGFKTNIKPEEDDFIAILAANSVFGGGAHSKLFNHVREKLSLAYYASSNVDKYKGLMLVNAGIEFENFQKAYDEIMVQLDNVKQGDISDFEFETAISSLVTSFESAYDDARYMQSICLGEIVSGTGCSIADYIKKLKDLKKQDLIKAMGKIELDTVYFLTGKGETA